MYYKSRVNIFDYFYYCRSGKASHFRIEKKNSFMWTLFSWTYNRKLVKLLYCWFKLILNRCRQILTRELRRIWRSWAASAFWLFIYAKKESENLINSICLDLACLSESLFSNICRTRRLYKWFRIPGVKVSSKLFVARRLKVGMLLIHLKEDTEGLIFEQIKGIVL